MKFTYSVTFEHPTLPVKTHRGTIVAAAPTAAQRAVKAARKALPFTHWTSLVVVLQKETEDYE